MVSLLCQRLCTYLILLHLARSALAQVAVDGFLDPDPTDFRDTVILMHAGTSLHECAANCSSMPVCSGFTYKLRSSSPSSGTCIMRSTMLKPIDAADAGGELVYSYVRDSVVGTIKGYFRLMTGQDYPDNNIGMKSIEANASMCADRCSKHFFCRGFVYLPKKISFSIFSASAGSCEIKSDMKMSMWHAGNYLQAYQREPRRSAASRGVAPPSCPIPVLLGIAILLAFQMESFTQTAAAHSNGFLLSFIND